MNTPFRTIVKVPKAKFALTHRDRIVSIGSCFSENVGRFFERYRFDIDINPFGQQYNPGSIANAINKLLAPVPYAEGDLVHQDELYHSFDHHGSFSRGDKGETLDLLNTRLLASSEKIKTATRLFLTFGTAHVFKLRLSGKIVSNCHKVPGREFDFELMLPDEIMQIMSDALDKLWTINPDLLVTLTVSPVRYFAFGHFENSVSKGNLFAAMNALMAKYPNLYYFPAYEIVMDDLRDYRFYADDMLHPTAQATEYVWEQLSKALMPADTLEIIKELDEINAALNHRPRNPEGEAHRKFREKYEEQMRVLEGKITNLDRIFV